MPSPEELIGVRPPATVDAQGSARFPSPIRADRGQWRGRSSTGSTRPKPLSSAGSGERGNGAEDSSSRTIMLFFQWCCMSFGYSQIASKDLAVWPASARWKIRCMRQ